jgi:hypothetical protein
LSRCWNDPLKVFRNKQRLSDKCRPYQTPVPPMIWVKPDDSCAEECVYWRVRPRHQSPYFHCSRTRSGRIRWSFMKGAVACGGIPECYLGLVVEGQVRSKQNNLQIKSEAVQKGRTHDPLFPLPIPAIATPGTNTTSTRMISNVYDLRYRCRNSTKPLLTYSPRRAQSL